MRAEKEMFLSTYFDCNADNAWRSIFEMCKLFESTAQSVGDKLGWEYNEKEGKAHQMISFYNCLTTV